MKCGARLRVKHIDNVKRLACGSETCQFVVWNNPVPVVAAIVLLDDQVLLARNAKWPAGVQSVITGYLERGESPEQAVLRELDEELGLQATSYRFLGNYSCFELNQLLICFVIQAQGDIRLSEELADYRLVPREALSPTDFGLGQVADWQALGMGIGPAIGDWLAEQ